MNGADVAAVVPDANRKSPDQDDRVKLSDLGTDEWSERLGAQLTKLFELEKELREGDERRFASLQERVAKLERGLSALCDVLLMAHGRTLSPILMAAR